jgi:ABC-type nitrate/sulfonate/bicarbonate transport system substrate-binding protein
MAGPKLTTVTRTQGNNQALKDGTVKPRGFELDFIEVDPLIAAFRRMVRAAEFDICEMAITTYICARSFGKPMTAVPIFLVRAFHHGAILANTKSGIRTPKDLEGKRVGVNRGYTVTTGVWARQKMGDMLASGELAAAIGVETDSPDVRPLIPDAFETGIAALRQRGLYPINHTVVIRDDLLAAHPQLATDVFGAFAAAKRVYLDRLKAGKIDKPTAFDALHKRVMEITGDPLPYGITPNREVIEELIGHAFTQGIISKPATVEELFAPSTHGLTA